MIGSYDYRLVALSVLIAVLASFAALDLAGRIAAASGRVRLVWLAGGAIAMGAGIWSMHYIGMLAFSLPVPVHAMEGSLWVDDKQYRLAEIKGRLIEKVRFGGGLLGHLDKGGTFDVKQEPVVPGYRELTVLNVRMTGRALFFKTIAVKQKYTRSEFKRVPDDLPIAQAAEMLKKHAAER